MAQDINHLMNENVPLINYTDCKRVIESANNKQMLEVVTSKQN